MGTWRLPWSKRRAPGPLTPTRCGGTGQQAAGPTPLHPQAITTRSAGGCSGAHAGVGNAQHVPGAAQNLDAMTMFCVCTKVTYSLMSGTLSHQHAGRLCLQERSSSHSLIHTPTYINKCTKEYTKEYTKECTKECTKLHKAKYTQATLSPRRPLCVATCTWSTLPAALPPQRWQFGTWSWRCAAGSALGC